MSISVRIVSTESNLESTNFVYCSGEDFKVWTKKGQFLRVLGQSPFFSYRFLADPSVKTGTLSLNLHQRVETFVAINDVVKIEVLDVSTVPVISLVNFVVSFKHKKKRDTASKQVNGEEIIIYLKENYAGHLLALNQKIQIKYQQTLLFTQVQGIFEKSSPKHAGTVIDENGLFTADTAIQLTPLDDSILLSGKEVGGGVGMIVASRPPPLRPEVTAEMIGVGGLGPEFSQLFRRAFASRCLHPQTVKKIGILHVRGILLYGPPGTGKTLLARNIAKMLNSVEPKRISGSEVLSKWYGEAERKIRELFKDAEIEQRDKGDYSSLHVIIIDELDAICRARSDTTNNVGDTIVNQLLSKIDGNEVLNNILIIGMTNRKDLIDKALLRPGRFEVHLEIGLPDEKGRKEILIIHTKDMAAANRLDKNVDLDLIAKEAKNFSGAEIAGLVRDATSCALERCLELRENDEVYIEEESVIVRKEDFEHALKEVVPLFGKNTDQLGDIIPKRGYLVWGDALNDLIETTKKYIEQLVNSPVLQLLSVLLVGIPGSGKTTLAAYLATQVPIPLIKIVSPEDFIGKPEHTVAGELSVIFKDLYKSQTSFLILDNIERLVSYSDVGHIYANTILQALLVLIKKKPPKNRKLFILATTSEPNALKLLKIDTIFNKQLKVPSFPDGKTIQDKIIEIEELRISTDPSNFEKAIRNDYGPPFLPLLSTEKQPKKKSNEKK